MAQTRLLALPKPWQHEDWRKANVTPVIKKGEKEEPGNYRPVSFTSIPGKVMEQPILGAVSSHIKDKRVVRGSQHGFTKGKCLCYPPADVPMTQQPSRTHSQGAGWALLPPLIGAGELLSLMGLSKALVTLKQLSHETMLILCPLSTDQKALT